MIRWLVAFIGAIALLFTIVATHLHIPHWAFLFYAGVILGIALLLLWTITEEES